MHTDKRISHNLARYLARAAQSKFDKLGFEINASSVYPTSEGWYISGPESDVSYWLDIADASYDVGPLAMDVAGKVASC